MFKKVVQDTIAEIKNDLKNPEPVKIGRMRALLNNVAAIVLFGGGGILFVANAFHTDCVEAQDAVELAQEKHNREQTWNSRAFLFDMEQEANQICAEKR